MNVSLLAEHISRKDNHIFDGFSRDDMNRVARECLRKGIPMPILLEPSAVWKGSMARAIYVIASLKHLEGEWKVDEMMKATEEANSEAERL